MRFIEKYTTLAKKTEPENTNKEVIGDDAFAIGEVIDKLIMELRKR